MAWVLLLYFGVLAVAHSTSLPRQEAEALTAIREQFKAVYLEIENVGFLSYVSAMYTGYTALKLTLTRNVEGLPDHKKLASPGLLSPPWHLFSAFSALYSITFTSLPLNTSIASVPPGVILNDVTSLYVSLLLVSDFTKDLSLAVICLTL
jgi:hypothetical protein